MKRKTVTVNLLGVTRKLNITLPNRTYPDWIDKAEYMGGKHMRIHCAHVMAYKSHVRKHGLV